MMVGSQAKSGDCEHEKNKAHCFLAYCHRHYFAVVFQSCYSRRCFQRRRLEWVNIIKNDVALTSPGVLTIFLRAHNAFYAANGW